MELFRELCRDKVLLEHRIQSQIGSIPCLKTIHVTKLVLQYLKCQFPNMENGDNKFNCLVQCLVYIRYLLNVSYEVLLSPSFIT